MGGRGQGSGMSPKGFRITPEEIDALRFYSDGNGRDMNLYLRTGDDSSNVYGPDYGADIADYSEIVDDLLQRSRLPQSMTAYRGGSINEVIDLMEGNDPNSLIGKTYSNKGFLSVTTDKSYAQSLANDSPGRVMFDIKLDKGAKVVDIEPYVKNNEHEILGATNIKFKITNARIINGTLRISMKGGK